MSTARELQLADRSGAGPTSPLTLSMSRYDIADYLAMAVETVSRALTDLRIRGVIAFGSVRSVQIRDRGALERSSEGPACTDHALRNNRPSPSLSTAARA